MMKVWCLLPLLGVVVVDAQRDSKWSWSSNNRNDIDGVRDRLINRRKFESLEDFRDRYEVNEHTTRKPITQGDDFYGNGVGDGGGGGGIGLASNGGGGGGIGGGYGFRGPNSITGNGYNGNGFGAFVPQGLGGVGLPGPNNFNNYPLYGNQFNGPYNPGFGYQPNNFKPGGAGIGPGFNNNFYPNGGFQQGFGNGINGPYGGGGFGPNRYPGAGYPGAGLGYNPLGNSAENGVLYGPGGPTGLYGRPPNYYGPNYGPNQLPFNGGGGGGGGGGIGGIGGGFGGAPGGFNNVNGGGFNNVNGGGFNNNYGRPFNGLGGGFPQNGIIPFNSKAGSDILADDDDPKERSLEKKSDE